MKRRIIKYTDPTFDGEKEVIEHEIITENEKEGAMFFWYCIMCIILGSGISSLTGIDVLLTIGIIFALGFWINIVLTVERV